MKILGCSQLLSPVVAEGPWCWGHCRSFLTIGGDGERYTPYGGVEFGVVIGTGFMWLYRTGGGFEWDNNLFNLRVV